MKLMLAAVCCLSLLSMPALGQKGKKATGAPMTDQQFVDFAAQTDMVEANLGQLAANAATGASAGLSRRASPPRLTTAHRGFRFAPIP